MFNYVRDVIRHAATNAAQQAHHDLGDGPRVSKIPWIISLIHEELAEGLPKRLVCYEAPRHGGSTCRETTPEPSLTTDDGIVLGEEL
jgi:hypothetical protein